MSEVLSVELKPVVCPIFATYSSKRADVVTVSRLFPGLGRDKLNLLCDRGEVRRKKTGEARADGVLYRISDILDWLNGRSEVGDQKSEGEVLV